MRDDPKELLTRSEEAESRHRAGENVESQHLWRRWEAPLYYPVVNDWIAEQNEEWLNEVRWPNGRSFAACLTHDVDTLQWNSHPELRRRIWAEVRHSRRPAQRIRNALGLAGLRKRPEYRDIFTPWVELENSHGFRSSFFFFPTRVSKRHAGDVFYRWDDTTCYQGEKVKAEEVVQDLHRLGWEVGLHASVHASTTYDYLAEQKDDLERVTRGEVVSVRQHNLRYEAAVTPALHESAGFQTDSTLGFNFDIGFRAGIAYPFALWDSTKKHWLQIIELPLVLHDWAILAPEALALDEDWAFEICREIVRRVIRTKGVVCLLWHPHSVIWPAWWRLYERLLAYIAESNGWGATAKEIRDWWVSQNLDVNLADRLEQLKGKPIGTVRHRSPIVEGFDW